MMKNLIEVNNLEKTFQTNNGSFKAIDNVSFNIEQGKITGFLGESGCGKSTTARCIVNIETPDSGSIKYMGKEITGLSERKFRPLRKDIQMIFQNPFSTLDPKMTVKQIMMEPLNIWKIERNEKEKIEKIKKVLKETDLYTGDDSVLDKKPGEFSGGQLQRIAIARALIIEPKFIIADEIVSALDTPVQNRILKLLVHLNKVHGVNILFISHDLAVIKKISDNAVIMKDGKIVDQGICKDLFESNNQYIKELSNAAFPFEYK